MRRLLRGLSRWWTTESPAHRPFDVVILVSLCAAIVWGLNGSHIAFAVVAVISLVGIIERAWRLGR